VSGPGQGTQRHEQHSTGGHGYRGEMTRKTLLPMVLATALALAGCASNPRPGPLGTAGNGGEQCIPGPRIGVIRAMGDFTLDNSGQYPVTVNKVTLGDDHGLGMGKPWLVPVVSTQPLIGVSYWPPHRTAWNRRILADGAVLRPKEDLNLVLEVWRTRNPSGTSTVNIKYTSDGTTYSLTEGWSVEVAANCS
jgi:hypothetical protein